MAGPPGEEKKGPGSPTNQTLNMAGPPCETWSTARHQHEHDGGAPPIRSSAHPWGLPNLSLRLLRQNVMANRLMLATLLVMAECALARVPAIMEHPAVTQFHSPPSRDHRLLVGRDVKREVCAII